MFNLAQQKDAILGVHALGEIAIASEYLLVLDDYPELRFLTTNFGLPIPSPEDKIDVPLAGGLMTHTAPMPKTNYSTPFVLTETVAGHGLKMMQAVAFVRGIAHRKHFNFTIYQGTETDHTWKWPCTHGLLHGFEAPEVDAENRTGLMKYSGQIAFHNFGPVQGNVVI